jgi:hypothetical protein
MFIGSINRYPPRRIGVGGPSTMLRASEPVARPGHLRPVRGNFTVERILSSLMDGVGRIFSNDVSIYSCALGWQLANASQPSVNPPHPSCLGIASERSQVVIKAQEFNWLEPYILPDPPLIATLLLAGWPAAAGLRR